MSGEAADSPFHISPHQNKGGRSQPNYDTSSLDVGPMSKRPKIEGTGTKGRERGREGDESLCSLLGQDSFHVASDILQTVTDPRAMLGPEVM